MISSIWRDILHKHPDITAVTDKYSGLTLTYAELYRIITCFAAGLQGLGVQKGDHISLFSENSAKWLIADQSILLCGAVDAVRGSQTPAGELLYILEHSDSTGLIVENLDTADKLKHHSLNFIICLSNEEIPPEFAQKYSIYSFDQIVRFGENTAFNPVQSGPDDLATIVYTSGTTGNPKGVMLTHGNLLSQIKNMQEPILISKGQKTLNVLPTWHIYERTCEYILLSKGVTMAYTNVANFRSDLKRYNPDYLVAVPRIWEAIHSGFCNELKKQPVFRQKLVNFFLKWGENHVKNRRILKNQCIDNINASIMTRIQAFANFCLTWPIYKGGQKLVYERVRSGISSALARGISGGGALAGYLEDFYETIGLEIQVGYGLTETSPVLALRQPECNIRRSAGKPVANTEIKLVDGVVFARGPQVMRGYYKDPAATNSVLSPDGWFNTGDLGWLTPENDLVLTGRSKDVIVLSNGENIEPQALEEALLKSPYISQVMLVGQDKSYLGALIVPNRDTIQGYSDSSDIYNCPKVYKLLKKELNEHIRRRPNYRPFENINCFRLLNEPFSVENGLLTRTMKLKKPEVIKRYRKTLEEMYK